MIVEPKVKGFICTTAHPTGCEKNVQRQIEYVKNNGRINGAKNALIIGASTGYGLASRICAAFGMGASTIGVSFEKEASGKRTATPGFYNTKSFDRAAAKDGIYSKSINGDAFSKEIKNEVTELIKNDLKKVDLVVYSLAAPRRTMEDGTTYNSVLKTVGNEFREKNWNLRDDTIGEAVVPVASEEEILSTVKVMGGEDWIEWIDVLNDAGVLSDNAVTIAYSYIGPKITYPIYHEGTIGQAKAHLFKSSLDITRKYSDKDIKAYVSVNKALVTQASAAIPVVPLYLSILYKIMKEKNIHEGCIEQMYRLYSSKVYNDNDVYVESDGMIHVDDLEMRSDVQNKVAEVWKQIDSNSLQTFADTKGYWDDFYKMFGFRVEGVDYSVDVEI